MSDTTLYLSRARLTDNEPTYQSHIGLAAYDKVLTSRLSRRAFRSATTPRRDRMGLFSRRRTQQALDNLRFILKAKTLSDLIARLERGGLTTLSAEWEVTIFDAFCRCIAVEVEPLLGGQSLIDLLIREEAIDGSYIAIEVTTITNENIESLNPIDEFWSRLRAAFEKFGLPSSGIHLSVSSRFHLQRKNAVVLALPSPHLIDESIKKHIYPMLQEIVATGRPSYRRIDDGETKLLVAWQPGKSTNSSSYGGFDRSVYAYQNALVNRLNEKRKQIKRSGHEGLSGIFVCDGGASFFELFANPRTSSYDIRSDVQGFLRQTNSVHFVSFLFVTTFPRSIAIETIFSASVPNSTRLKIETLFKKVSDRLPQPLTDPSHAVRIMKFLGGNKTWPFDHSYPSFGRDLTGRESISIKVPAAAVVKFLGGKMTFDEFSRAAGFSWHQPGETHGNVLMGGGKQLSLSDVRLRRTESDDDWIVFDFVDDDPANTKFR